MTSKSSTSSDKSGEESTTASPPTQPPSSPFNPVWSPDGDTWENATDDDVSPESSPTCLLKKCAFAGAGLVPETIGIDAEMDALPPVAESCVENESKNLDFRVFISTRQFSNASILLSVQAMR